jgi:hypothetical protein
MILKILIATIMLIALNTPLTMAVDLEDIPLSIRQSVVRLSGSESCATGFIVGDQIVTNAHVTESLCPYGNCDPITVKIMDSKETDSWKFLTDQSGILVREIPSLDIALLKIPNIPQSPISREIFLSAPVGSDVTTLGFPGCKEFTVSEGKVLSKNILSFHTSALNSPGSSGSPIFDNQFNIIGIVAAAGTLFEAVSSEITDFPSSTKAVDAKAAQIVLWVNESELPLVQMKMLNTFYRESVIPSAGLDRLKTSWEWSFAADGIWGRATFLQLNQQTSFALASGMGDSLEFLKHPFPSSTTPELLEAEKLGAAYALELFGLKNNDLEEIDIADLLNKLQNSGRSTSHIEALEYLISRAYIHEPAEWLTTFLKTALFVLPLLCVWGWTLGYVYQNAHGAWYLRLIKMTIVGVGFWPLSLIVFGWLKRPHPVPEFSHSR